MLTKDLKLELKAVQDDGTFEGYLSVYDEVDLGNDLVEKGAFTKTIQEQKGIVPLLWHHDPKMPMGVLHLEDDAVGLKVKGEMFIGESDKAREMHGMAKRYQQMGRPMGLSIGYDTIKKAFEKGIRHLKELKLYEGSMTLFPMLTSAVLTSIKSALSPEAKADFVTELERAQLSAMRYMMIQALDTALYSILWDWNEEFPDAASKVAASDESIEQFHAAYVEFLPKLLALWGEKTAAAPDAKAGRRISASTRKEIESAITTLQALLEAETSTSDPAEAASVPAPEGAKTVDPGTAQPAAAAAAAEPPVHSLLAEFKSQLTGAFKWN